MDAVRYSYRFRLFNLLNLYFLKLLDDPVHNSFHAPDLEDVRESVRQGVTKVAGKLSSLANGVMSSLQVEK